MPDRFFLLKNKPKLISLVQMCAKNEKERANKGIVHAEGATFRRIDISLSKGKIGKCNEIAAAIMYSSRTP
jgi:hypothetical protein